MYLLEEIHSSKILINFPYFCQSSHLEAADNNHNDQTSNHDKGLEHVCPDDGLQTTLEGNRRNQMMMDGTDDDDDDNDDGDNKATYRGSTA